MSPSDRIVYQQASGATEFITGVPDIVVMPISAEEISEVLKLANETRVPVVPRGGGESQFGANMALRGGILVDMVRLDKIIKIDEQNMVVVAEGGCSVYKIMSELDKRGLSFPISPVFTPGPQIGACVAVNCTGHHMCRSGRLGDNIVGLEVVLPTGEIVTLGSGAYKDGYGHYHRYTGVPDLIGLFVNSSGIYGIVTKVAVRIKKKSNKLTYLAFSWPRQKIADVADCLYGLQKESVYDAFLVNSWALFGGSYNWTTTKGETRIKDELILLLTVDGLTDEDLRIRESYYSSICRQNGGINLGPELPRRLLGPPYYEAYTVVGITSRETEAAGIHLRGRSIAAYFHCPVLKLPEIYKLWEDSCKKYGYWDAKYIPAWLSWSGTNEINPFPMLVTVAVGDKDELAKAKSFWDEFNERLTELGVCQYAYGPALPPVVFQKLGPAGELVRKIKCCLDPNTIMNPFLE